MPILHEHIEGKYEILGKLREGGMGAVYKVRHRLLDDVRVVKILNPRLDVTPELNDRFLREARFAIQLRHPNIAQLHDFSIAEDGSAFIVMEFIDGATLEDIVARTGPPPLGLGLEMARQSLKAVGFLHRRGMIHRDISPDNLMLTRDAEGEPLVKLIDLGIAKVLKGGTGALTSTGMFLGKPRYASPEQFSATGLEGVDARADLYSFGVVLYELLTGVCPVQGRDPGSLMAGHLFRPPLDFAESDPDGRLPADLRAILLRTLAKVPDERFATAEELARALGEVQDRFPVKPDEIDAILAKAALPVPTAPPPGSTQEKLDQQFAKVATPAPAGLIGTQPAGRSLDATLVLGAQERPVVPAVPAGAVAETMAVPRNAAPVQVPEAVRPVPTVPVTSPPPISRPAPASPRVEALRPIRQPDLTPKRRRSLVPLVAASLMIALLAFGLGIWLWPRVLDLVAPVAAVDLPPAVPAVSESAVAAPAVSTAPSIALPIAEPAPSGAAPAPVPQKPEPAPVREPPIKKNVEQPEIHETREPTAVDPVSQSADATATSTEKLPGPETVHVVPEQPKDTGKQAKVDEQIYEAVPTIMAPSGYIRPQLRSVPTPTFPVESKGKVTYARIIVAVQLDAKGKVINSRVTKVSFKGPASQAFLDAAQAAARGAHYDPALLLGKPVESLGELMFEFGKRPGN